MKYLILIAVLINSLNCFADDVKLDVLWKARGLQAKEKIDEIKKEIAGKKKIPKEKQCELTLEEYYEAHTSPTRSKMLHEITKSGEAYHIVFVDTKNEQGGQLTLVKLIYGKLDKKKPVGISLVALGYSWSFSMLTEQSDSFMISNENCVFTFSIHDPLAGVAASK